MNSKGREMNFEKALTELEQIVNKLEKGGLSLNESLALFEKGIKLARFLRAELDKAERKVEILIKNEKGELKPQEFEPEDLEADFNLEEPEEETEGKESEEEDQK
ncbi:MAG TPA: exodeoxyribonuclease VII small subunit [Candidatus Saccharicenans sp.]|nr:exodeoxyribonuclease VII small subunit [Candidatus Saccharicenans sp.]HOL45308.1 exodeoxyribonuclease VII small subunit [Candidatus Saccharicenans sp.]HOT69077.1 exodeoxyribonuclease VII small subunit [Candidatus Saccharicenans sp.]HPP23711.1 exodeoxyribonuclease VII small subunit [Candidatus Saccharicenans sp.]HQH60842.1 exodeoxyribonuclease VII small subunit [Candidatus Saccharicenans sp.]